MSGPQFLQPPQRQRKTSDWIVDWLRDAIISGQLRPGEPLKLVALAKQAEVSTTPIREALSRLRDEGLVVGDSHRTFQVAALTLEEIRDYYLLHAFLSGVLAERAAKTLSQADLQRLHELDDLIRERNEAGDMAGLHEANFEFHRLINKSATDVLRRFVTVTTRLVSRRSNPNVEGWTHSIEDHAAILKALDVRDGAAARYAMERHIHNVGQAVVEDLQQRGLDGVTASA
ncbi:GntR family transcriptional regulator [Amycolatopsis sp. K13G38]|uniref:GntR family transcriptional regulator n=1 Tax=Amycolatopsis acididurans TaxID=2724524 RepID=A0ABX1J8W9_9PSEU|nr:GntR family transcriptional regulator [Amycolatopsis acididurans]NKQ56153.1 GntR family transcriptional regulator [Amycolatopsis acididurans]